MTTNKQMNKTLAIVLSLMILLSVFVPIQPVEAATEKALSSKSWSSSMTTILKSKNGQGYEEAGMCTGYVAWAINHSGLYAVPSWPSNGFVSDFEARLKSMGVTRVSESEARAGDIVFFGDEHVAILGADGKLHHNYSAGVRSGEHTIDWWVKNGGNKAGSATIYRGFTQEIDVEISITKESADKTFVDGNACYSLSGAKYGVYSGSTLLKTLTTNASGKASGTITVMPDVAKNIKIKEISPSKVYGLDTNTYTKDGSSGKITITSKEPPVGDPATVLLYKADAETGKYLNAGELKEYYPQKAGSLEGAVFEVNFYGKYIEAEPVERTVSDNNLLRTWYIETDANGYARLGESWFADGYDQDALYKDRNTGTVTLPLGTVTIQEIVAPAGYHINDNIYVSDITQDGNNVIVHTYQEPVIKDQIKRGDIDLLKIADGSAKRLAGVPFMITALQEDGKASSRGESHIIVTDDNGYASTANSHNAHKNKTNANDAAWNGENIDESKLDPAAGVWFGNVEALKGSKGALPYGTYRIDELPCEANEGYKLIKGLEVTISRDGYTVPLGTLTDKKNELETTVWDSDINEERVTLARDNITLTDRVRYSSMYIPEAYRQTALISQAELDEENLFMCDTGIRQLIPPALEDNAIIFPYSRLYCDVERFRDGTEPMDVYGMGYIYCKTSTGKDLFNPSESHGKEISSIYDAHHEALNRRTTEILEAYGKCLIIDLHSFSDETVDRLFGYKNCPDVCIGTEPDFYDAELVAGIEYFCMFSFILQTHHYTTCFFVYL